MSLTATDIAWHRGARAILSGISFTLHPGELLGLLGPNGAGKSSLLRILAGLRKPGAGTVHLGGTPLAAIPRRALARRLAFVDQHAATDAPVTVDDVVRLGRTPHRGPFAAWTPADEAAVAAALAETDLLAKRHQRWSTLSGGEQQRTQLARALAQSPTELLLDEPTNHLDIAHQLEILALLRRLPVSAVAALHDLNLAAAFCDRVLLLRDGRPVAIGPPHEILVPSMIAAVFGVHATVTDGHIRFARP